jgi:diaminohydroxyphosphoribosylaminopyrimidine deaminase/5-amino-6-(5-phosphoribosylamino)uracil reductase
LARSSSAATAKPPGLDLPAVLHALSDKGITRLIGALFQ